MPEPTVSPLTPAPPPPSPVSRGPSPGTVVSSPADAVECEAKCGRAADDLDGFEDALAERLQVQFR